jgi:hypothetical protein
MDALSGYWHLMAEDKCSTDFLKRVTTNFTGRGLLYCKGQGCPITLDVQFSCNNLLAIAYVKAQGRWWMEISRMHACVQLGGLCVVWSQID